MPPPKEEDSDSDKDQDKDKDKTPRDDRARIRELRGEVKDLTKAVRDLKSSQSTTGEKVQQTREKKVLNEVFRSLPSYGNTADSIAFTQWIRQYNEVMNAQSMNEEQAARLLPILLIDNAKAEWRRLPVEVQTDWQKCLKELKKAFAPRDQKTTAQKRLSSRKQGQTESVADFAEAIETLVLEAFPEPTYTKPNQTEQMISHFIGKLKPALFAPVQRLKRPETMDAAVTAARDEEKLQEELVTVELEQASAERATKIVRDLDKISERINAVEQRQFGEATNEFARGSNFPNRGYNRDTWRGNGRNYQNQNNGYRGRGYSNQNTSYNRGGFNNRQPWRSRGRGRRGSRGRGGNYNINMVESTNSDQGTSSGVNLLPFGLCVTIGLLAMCIGGLPNVHAVELPKTQQKMEIGWKNMEETIDDVMAVGYSTNVSNELGNKSEGQDEDLWKNSKRELKAQVKRNSTTGEIYHVIMTKTTSSTPTTAVASTTRIITSTTIMTSTTTTTTTTTSMPSTPTTTEYQEIGVTVLTSPDQLIPENTKSLYGQVTEILFNAGQSLQRVLSSADKREDPWTTRVSRWFSEAPESISTVLESVRNKTGSILKPLWDTFNAYYWWFIFPVALAIVSLTALYFYCLYCPRPTFIRKKRTHRRHQREEVEMQRNQVNAVQLQGPRFGPYLTFVPIVMHLVAVVHSSTTDGFPYIPVFINNHRAVALVDSGASLTYCGETLARQLNGARFLAPTLPPAKAANGTNIPFLGRFPATILLGDEIVNVELHYTSDRHCPAQVLLGCDLMRDLNRRGLDVSLNLIKEHVRIGRKNIPFVKKNEVTTAQANYVLMVDENVTIGPRTDNVLWVKSKGNLPTQWTMMTGPEAQGNIPEFLQVGKTVAKPTAGRYLPIRIRNITRTPYQLFKNQTVALAEKLEMAETVNYVNTPAGIEAQYVSPEVDVEKQMPDLPQRTKQPPEERVDLSSGILTAYYRKQLKELLRRMREAFVGTDGRIGYYKGNVYHRIDLEPCTIPPRQAAYRVPLQTRTEVERQIQDLLQQGIIKESVSPFAAPIVMVQKADKRSWRMAIDYRRLNAVTKKQAFHLPQIQDILDLTSGAKIYSTLDMQAGYHQLPVFPSHTERTAFISHMGLYEFLRLPFGLSSAPTTFQRTMDEVLRGCTAAVYVYLDDIVISSQTMRQHFRDLEEVLRRFIKNGLKLKAEKCVFAQSEVKYLGFLISEAGMRPDPKNIEVIKKFEAPKNVSEVRSFLGAIGYFRRFILLFAKIAEPLAKLTRKESAFEWTTEHQNSFQELIKRLISAPILAPPRLDKPFEIWTDASIVAIAAILLQMDDEGYLHPIVFSSRMLNRHERNYAVIEWEALAIVFAVRQFRPYVEGLPFKVITDHQPLKALLRRRDLQGRLARFQLALAPYDIDIEYRQGSLNHLADMLSRRCSEEEQQVSKLKIQAVTSESMPKYILGMTITRQQVAEELQKDKFWFLVYEYLDQGSLPASKDRERIQKVAEKMEISGNLLFKRERVNGNRSTGPLMFIPATLRKQIIQEFHSCPLDGGHLGVNKTAGKLNQRFFWPGLQEDVRQVVTECVPCQKRKTPAPMVSREPMCNPEMASRPFQRLHTDIVGPLPMTTAGNEFLLTNMDPFSKFAITTPLSNQKAETVARALIEDVFCIHGVVDVLISDQGSNYMSAVMANLAEIAGFKHVRTTAWHPQSNGQVERFNKTIVDSLAACLSQRNDEWDQLTPWITFSYNVSIQASIRESPYFVVFGRQPRLMQDTVLNLPVSQYADVSDYRNTLIKSVQASWKAVSDKIIQQQQLNKTQYDDRPNISEHEIEEGELVLVNFPQPPRSEAAKFYAPWRGPFRVIQIRRPDVTVIDITDGKIKTVHLNRTKKFREDRQLPLRSSDRAKSRQPEGRLQAERAGNEDGAGSDLQEQSTSKEGRVEQRSRRAEERMWTDEELAANEAVELGRGARKPKPRRRFEVEG